MAISRLQASLAQATNEVTIAAANINFDFCLVKYEAPKEYRPLGKLLSLRRKQDAEHGKIHATARRLAALFDEVCPDTPNLIKAYGERVSDISKQATDQESRDYSRSVFGSYAGIDGTSIWAAATSSETAARGAIQVHLLACILSLMFDAAEATSIWIELVEERRRAITTSWEQDEPLPFSLAQAAGQQEITRGQLAEWDSSARAWLQTADSIMAKKQTQLRLILKNIKLPMGSETGVYPSVIDTWKKALLTMERLVSGVPQEVQDGSAIIGLAAWHIYPDINYFGTRTVEVRMNDLLVASGGILSLGCSPSATTPMSGISWSLSLTQLKYYGQPVQRRGSFRPDPERISFKELVFTVLGCVLSRWHVSTCRTQTSEAIEVINLIWENFKGRVAEYANNSPTSQTSFRRRIEGLRLLSEAAKEYSEDEDTSLPFINLGRNRCQFLPCRTYIGGLSQPYLHPFFGLCSVKTLLKSFRNSDGRVEFLRRMAMRTKSIEGRTCIIQYTEVHTQDIELINYASVFPRRSENAMDGQEHNAKKSGAPYTRWLHRDLMSMNWTREMVYENDGIYTPSLVPRLICSYKKSRPRETFDLQYWYGDSDTAAIYIRSDELSTPVVPKITPQDVLWCLKHDLLSPEIFMLNDSIMRTLDCLAMADTNAFQTIPGPVIQVQILGKPLIDAGCMAGVTDNERRLEAHPRISAFNQAISILSYFVASHDIPHSKIPCNIVGISMGDSIFVPEQLLCDPLVLGNGSPVTRILGNIGRPGFVMFFSVENPILSPQDPTFWRVANSQDFDGTATDLFDNTSMHLSFTNWERPIEDFSSRGNQDVQLAVMESVISIRERGRWIGDVDVIVALRSPTIYKLPAQEACNHSKSEPPGVHMASIECWDELREFPAGNVVVRANGNWLARLATTAFLAQCAEKRLCDIKRITLCPPSVCWMCLKEYVEQFPSNIYIY